MHHYLIYRKGSNAANQSMTFGWVPIAIVEASSRWNATQTTWGGEEPNVHSCPKVAANVIAHCGNLDVWANQSLKAVPESRAPRGDWNAVLEADAMRV
jgi:hypothetical protein